jgi:hypothetical protein
LPHSETFDVLCEAGLVDLVRHRRHPRLSLRQAGTARQLPARLRSRRGPPIRGPHRTGGLRPPRPAARAVGLYALPSRAELRPLAAPTHAAARRAMVTRNAAQA